MFSLEKLSFVNSRLIERFLPSFLAPIVGDPTKFNDYYVFIYHTFFGFSGFIIGKVYQNRFNLIWIYTLPSYRSMGAGSTALAELASYLKKRGILSTTIQLCGHSNDLQLIKFLVKNGFELQSSNWCAYEFSRENLLYIPTVKKPVTVREGYRLLELDHHDLLKDASYLEIIHDPNFKKNFRIDDCTSHLCKRSSVVLLKKNRVVGWVGSTEIKPYCFKLSPLYIEPSEPQLLGIKIASYSLRRIYEMGSSVSAVIIASKHNERAFKLINALGVHASKKYEGSYYYKQF